MHKRKYIFHPFPFSFKDFLFLKEAPNASEGVGGPVARSEVNRPPTPWPEGHHQTPHQSLPTKRKEEHERQACDSKMKVESHGLS